MWVIGGRSGQNVVALDIKSGDSGKTLTGTMTYAGEAPIGFRAVLARTNTYLVENQLGGGAAHWHPGGTWILGGRDQPVVAVDIFSSDSGKTLNGDMTYAGEHPVGFEGISTAGNNYSVQIQWGGSSSPWHPGGVWLLGCRAGQSIVELNVTSGDKGNTFNGTMTYYGEGPIGFRATALPQ